MIPFNRPHLFPEGFTAVKEACSAGKLTGEGLNSRRCAALFRERFQYERCLLTPSCTAALEIAALVLKLAPGDEVIVPSFTFVSTANAFALRGVTIVFADSEEDTPNMSINHALTKITPNTKAIVVVHYAGVPLNLQPLLETGIPVVEDCAHALGSTDPYIQSSVGSQGCLAAFSFHETKNIGIGEGGMLVVNDPNMLESAQAVQRTGTNQKDFVEGRCKSYTWLTLGSAYLMSEVGAGLLYGALLHYDYIQTSRLAIWDRYNTSLPKSPFYRKPCPKTSRANAHIYYLTFSANTIRDEFCSWMKAANVSVATHYPPLDQSPFALQQKSSPASTSCACPEAQKWSLSIVRLPLFYGLAQDELNTIIEAVTLFVETKMNYREEESYCEADEEKKEEYE